MITTKFSPAATRKLIGNLSRINPTLMAAGIIRVTDEK